MFGKINTIDTTIAYRGKKYSIWRVKGTHPARPIGEENDPSQEIIVKDYNQWGWNATVNVNGELVVVEWGVYKHLTVWGSLILLILLTYFLIKRYLIKKRKRWGWMEKHFHLVNLFLVEYRVNLW